ncbi:MAG: histidine phosphatase family protein, partial [Gammaproteobacteria bacterium]|nr:histidine phosphatase family protein [Gammaproteobacteria bacterium]
ACDAFYFLRHGQTEGNARRIFQSVDVPLSALGLEQAARAARLLADEPIRSMVCSDILRAHHTARTVAEPHGLQPRVLRGLRERDFGALIGTSSAALDWACVPEGGETLGAFVERTRTALSDALADPAPVLVVAHGGSLLVTAALLGVDVDLSVLGNAQPLRFARTATTWAVTPLLPQQEAGADLA